MFLLFGILSTVFDNLVVVAHRLDEVVIGNRVTGDTVDDTVEFVLCPVLVDNDLGVFHCVINFPTCCRIDENIFFVFGGNLFRVAIPRQQAFFVKNARLE